jgi:hypothetical protein
MKTKKKKKLKPFQLELRLLYEVKWKYVSGEICNTTPKSGTTVMEAVSPEEAERLWYTSHNYAQRKFKILSVKEVTGQPKQNHEQTSQQRVGTSKEHGEWDEPPDF